MAEAHEAVAFQFTVGAGGNCLSIELLNKQTRYL